MPSIPAHTARSSPLGALACAFSAVLAGSCGDPEMMMNPPPPPPPAGMCTYEPAPVPTGAGMPIVAGPVVAGVGEAPIDLPVGTPMGGYTARMRLLGGSAPDARNSPHARAFAPSAGVQTQPLARALYIKAGSEPVLMIKADLCVAFDRLVFDLEAALQQQGLMPARGRVLLTTSHTHSGPGTYQGTFHLALGFDLFEESQYQRLLASLLSAAKAAIKNPVPARLGLGVWEDWDKADAVYSDRRDEDDMLKGKDGKPIGSHKEQRLLVMRVDDDKGAPLAMMLSFPMHGTIGGEDSPLFSVDATGHLELALEERFDRKVMVMHMQGPAGDASPRGRGGIASCDDKTTLCGADFARMESIGEVAAPRIYDLWRSIQTAPTAALEMVTRSVRNGRDIISVRDGMRYSPYEPERDVDSTPSGIYTPDGKVRSPITQFNVAHGAGLCGDKKPMLPVSGILGATGAPYASCADIDGAGAFIAGVLKVEAPAMPTCETTRTTLSALRLDSVPVLRRHLDMGGTPVDEQSQETMLLLTLPGEPVSLLADALRERSPAGAERTFVIGYAQGHIGYLLGVENWLLGGYEPSINIFGPLEGEWLMERSLDLAKLAVTAERDDAEAQSGGERFDRLAYKPGPATMVPRAPATQAGSVPATLPASVLWRTRVSAPTQAQPAAQVLRVSGRATFAFYGGDPEEDMPEVTLERETAAGSNVFMPVLLPSGRALSSRGPAVLLTYTPDPVDAAPGLAKGHVWAAEWQATGWEQTGKSAMAAALEAQLGRYRFAARGRAGGKEYTLTSSPFTVVAEGALQVTATRTGTRVMGRAGYPVGPGYRLLRLDGSSSGDVPVQGAISVRVRSQKDGMTQTFPVMSPDGQFNVDATGLDVSMGVVVTVEDRAVNSGQLTIP